MGMFGDNVTRQMLRRIEGKVEENSRKLDALLRGETLILQNERAIAMATKETLDRMIADVTANTNATNAAAAAITHLTDTNADLVKQLQDAVSNGDEDAVKAAADALEANNAALQAATPQIAAAIVAGTPAA